MKRKPVIMEVGLPAEGVDKEREARLGKEVAHAAIKVLAADTGEQVIVGKVEVVAAYRTGLFHLAGDDPKRREFLHVGRVLNLAFEQE